MARTDDEFTTIQVTVGTREKLKGMGKKDETYEEIILRLMGEKASND